jgi:HAD superfamily hydrolase (TIGR01509 family)
MIPQTPLRAVVFDLDGLMVNTEDLYRRAGGEVLRRRGKPYDEALFSAMMGRPPKIALGIMKEWHALQDSVEALGLECGELLVPIIREHLAPMPGLLDLLNALEKGAIPKAIATSSPRVFLTEVLGRFGWQDRFDFLLTCEDVTHGKPNPEIYLAAAARHGRLPGEVLVLEDSQAGCQAAVAAGAFAVAVPSEYSRSHDFSGAAFVANTLADPAIYAALSLPR